MCELPLEAEKTVHNIISFFAISSHIPSYRGRKSILPVLWRVLFRSILLNRPKLASFSGSHTAKFVERSYDQLFSTFSQSGQINGPATQTDGFFNLPITSTNRVFSFCEPITHKKKWTLSLVLSHVSMFKSIIEVFFQFPSISRDSGIRSTGCLSKDTATNSDFIPIETDEVFSDTNSLQMAK